jgi:hypothetical protein
MKSSKGNIPILISALLVGWFLGTVTTPQGFADTPTPQGEVLKICVDKKSGALRASSLCTKSERATVLGGVGARGSQGAVGNQGVVGPAGGTGGQGIIGATGSTGPQGVQGFSGQTGPAGSVQGLRQQSITFYNSYSTYGGCSSWGASFLNGNTSISSGFSNSPYLNKACSTLSSQTISVYTP